LIDNRWQVSWTSDPDGDPRLVRALPVGPVTGVAWHDEGPRPLLAVRTREEVGHRVRVWDVLSAEPADVPGREPPYRMAFGTLAGETVLVSAHDADGLRIWDVAGRRALTTVPVGDFPATDVHLGESDGRLVAVTLDPLGRVHRWSLPDGTYLGGLQAPTTYALWSGRRDDGRLVLLTFGDGMSLWDLVAGTRLPLRVPDLAGKFHGGVLSTLGVTVRLDTDVIVTFDPATGEVLGPPVTAHHQGFPDNLAQVWDHARPAPPFAVAGGVLAVPTAWRIDLPGQPPITGPVGHSTVQTVRFAGRELLLTASAYDGVVALWDPTTPAVGAPGHTQRVTGVSVVQPGDEVVSVDAGGTIVVRGEDGSLETGADFTRSVVAWRDGATLRAVTGAGDDRASDGKLRRWNLTTGTADGPPVPAHPKYVSEMALVDGKLVTFGPGAVLKIWRLEDLTPLAEIPTEVRSRTTGFAAGETYVALSSLTQPLTVHRLDDPAAPPILLPQAGDDVLLTVAGERLVTASSLPRTVRVWSLTGDLLLPAVPIPPGVVGAVVRAWPELYVAHADGTVTLLDLEAGREICPPTRLPARPGPMAITADGDLVIGYSNAVARLRPRPW
jgi:WD40 repeat protein